ncbi:hypothetical protein [Streptomyces sp. 147326]|uniref:hypothetical protein n=1 Tax=Streptomyces sp. 147326 TaxID=3074379 RepID=UPI0038577261
MARLRRPIRPAPGPHSCGAVARAGGGGWPSTRPDWTTLPNDKPLYEADVDLAVPIADCDAHLSVIRYAAVQLPADLTAPLSELVRQLDGLASEEPLVALKALADLRYVITQVGEDAAYELAAADVPIGEVATALGTSEAAARSYLGSYLHP